MTRNTVHIVAAISWLLMAIIAMFLNDRGSAEMSLIISAIWYASIQEEK